MTSDKEQGQSGFAEPTTAGVTETPGASNVTNTLPGINVAANDTDQTRPKHKIKLTLKALARSLTRCKRTELPSDKKPPTCKETALMKNGDAELEVRQEFNRYTALYNEAKFAHTQRTLASRGKGNT